MSLEDELNRMKKQSKTVRAAVSGDLSSFLSELSGKKSVDPIPAFKFTIEVGGSVLGRFTECSGLNLEREVQTYKEGGVNDHVHMLPGRTTQSRVTMKRGITADKQLWDWYEMGLYTCLVQPRTVSIVLYARDSRSELRRWNLIDAYPVKWTGPSLNTASTDVAFETIELAHQGLTMVSSSGGLISVIRSAIG